MPIPKTWTSPPILFAAFIIVILVLAALRVSSSSPVASSANLAGTKITVYKSPTCGCCANYVSYLKRSGLDVDVVTTTEMNAVKESNGVPTGYTSCHTSVIDNYVVEGHIPLETIGKLLQDRPSLSGITLPGMPAGTPGMPGVKQGTWSVYGWRGTDIPTIFLDS